MNLKNSAAHPQHPCQRVRRIGDLLLFFSPLRSRITV